MHFAGIHSVSVPKKKKINRLYFNNRDIVSFIESCCGQRTAIQNEANREAVRKKHHFSFPFGFLFNYKIFARTDIATNQMRIHVALKICNTRSNLVFRYSYLH